MKDIIRMNQLAGIITEGQARKMIQVLNENQKPDWVSMSVFLERLGVNPNDPLFKAVIKSGDIYEIMNLLVDTVGDGDPINPFDGIYTQGDFYQAAQDAQFSKDMIEDILDMDEIRHLERG